MHWKALPLGVKGKKIVIYLVPHLMPGRNPQTQITGIGIKMGLGGGVGGWSLPHLDNFVG